MLRKNPEGPPPDRWNLRLILVATTVIVLGGVAMRWFGVDGYTAPAVAGVVAGECFVIGTCWRRR